MRRICVCVLTRGFEGCDNICFHTLLTPALISLFSIIIFLLIFFHEHKARFGRNPSLDLGKSPPLPQNM